MKNIFFIMAMASALLFTGCSNAQSSNQPVTSENNDQVINKDVNVAEFATLVEKKEGLLLDVRTNQEYAAGHLEGATQIDFYSPDFQAKIKELDPETPVYVYCRSGGRSGQTAKMMKNLGFKAVYNLEGGIGAWQGSGKPVVQ
jgi:rhodanese-related sulfurtransferase